MSDNKDPSMRCPICDSLLREHSLMCEVEATASIQQRYGMMLAAASSTPDSERDEMLLLSRKRQAKIVTRLEDHKARAHSA